MALGLGQCACDLVSAQPGEKHLNPIVAHAAVGLRDMAGQDETARVLAGILVKRAAASAPAKSQTRLNRIERELDKLQDAFRSLVDRLAVEIERFDGGDRTAAVLLAVEAYDHAGTVDVTATVGRARKRFFWAEDSGWERIAGLRHPSRGELSRAIQAALADRIAGPSDAEDLTAISDTTAGAMAARWPMLADAFPTPADLRQYVCSSAWTLAVGQFAAQLRPGQWAGLGARVYTAGRDLDEDALSLVQQEIVVAGPLISLVEPCTVRRWIQFAQFPLGNVNAQSFEEDRSTPEQVDDDQAPDSLFVGTLWAEDRDRLRAAVRSARRQLKATERGRQTVALLDLIDADGGYSKAKARQLLVGEAAGEPGAGSAEMTDENIETVMTRRYATLQPPLADEGFLLLDDEALVEEARRANDLPAMITEASRRRLVLPCDIPRAFDSLSDEERQILSLELDGHGVAAVALLRVLGPVDARTEAQKNRPYRNLWGADEIDVILTLQSARAAALRSLLIRPHQPPVEDSVATIMASAPNPDRSIAVGTGETVSAGVETADPPRPPYRVFNERGELSNALPTAQKFRQAGLGLVPGRVVVVPNDARPVELKAEYRHLRAAVGLLPTPLIKRHNGVWWYFPHGGVGYPRAEG